MRVVHGESFPYVYSRVIEEVLLRPDKTSSPRGLKCKAVAPLIMQFPVHGLQDGTFESPARSTDRRYLAAELLWYYHGLRDVESIARFSKFWRGIANEDGSLNSAYGHQLFVKKNSVGMTEWQWAMQSLAKDPDTRQAVMVLHEPHQHRSGNKDVPCTLNVAFERRGEYLDMVVTMRSNDLWYGVPYDVPFFISLLRNACMLLDATPGLYTHMALNMHAYEKDWSTLRQMLADGITAPEEPMPFQELPWVDWSGACTSAFLERKDALARYCAEVTRW